MQAEQPAEANFSAEDYQVPRTISLYVYDNEYTNPDQKDEAVFATKMYAAADNCQLEDFQGRELVYIQALSAPAVPLQMPATIL